TIPPNPDPATRLLTATIAGQTFNVTQGGAACTTSLDSLSASLSSAGGGGTVGVTTPSGCGYSTVLGPGWIHVTSGASGSASGTLLYSVDANSTTVGRSGSIVIGGQAFQITQEPLACSATLDTSGLGSPYGVAGGSGAIGITTNGPNCSWTASSDNGWLSVSPPSGTGNATLVVGVGSNAGSLTGRTGALTVAGQTVGVSQGGTVCNYSLQSSIGTAPAGGGAGSVGVIAPAACTWAAVSNDPSWLSISSSGTAGSSDVNFVAQANTAATPRSGTLTVAGLIYTVNQGPAPCAYTLTSGGITVGASGGSDSFGFSTTTSGCSPAVQSFASWLHASSPPLVGTSGTVSWTADANPSGANRVGVIQVGTQTFVVTQLGAACAFSLNAYGAYFSAAGLTGNYFLGSPSGLGCTPTVSVDLPSIVMLGALSGPVSDVFTQGYDVLPFVNVGPAVYRRAKITFGGQIFIVKQSSW
ncbi:MAG TPA: BACON domain-containing carbohydrate-binding protein, partial [Vicinamibacterales bacterium]|nr:BACON domain-containing carbohydrate-binding protein [Vicinamibacterales bacterium]